MTSYRQSHQGRGSDYHKTFSDLPYRALMWKLEQRVLRQVLSATDPQGSAKYLDFACGTGRILSFVEPLVGEAWGVDVSSTMLEQARSRVSHSQLVEGDLTREQLLEPESFDLITAFRFFPNAEPTLRDEVMRELARHLKPGGRLIFGNHRHSRSLRNRVKRLLGRPVDGMSAREGEALVLSHGLQVEKVVPLGVWPGREGRAIAGSSLAGAVERLVARSGLARPIANTLIYVCRKTQPA